MNRRLFEQFLERAHPHQGEVSYDQHPSEQTLEAYVHDRLNGPFLSRVSVHVATCDNCAQRIVSLRREMQQLDQLFTSHLEEVVTPRLLTRYPSRTTGLQHWLETMSQVREWLSPSGGVSLARLSVYAAGAAAILVAVNLTLDRVLVPPVNPLASPAPVNRWWVYLYWLLVPITLPFVLRGWRQVRMFLQRRGKDDHDNN